MLTKRYGRRAVLGAAGTLVLAPVISACSSIIRLFRVSKQEANYQDMPRNGQACAGCRYFHAPNVCDRVEGPVSPNGWCRFWSAR
jgi:hypothetical protein